MNAVIGPTISVVTATYNALPGLRRTIASVAGQKYEQIEHVIVDGGSSDGTPAYLATLGEKVRWVSEPDNGIADAMNKGVAMATGDWIIVLHAEDTLFDADSVAMAAGFLSDTEMVGFDVLFDRGDKGTERLPSRPWSRYSRYRMLNPHQGLFCRRAIFEDIGGFDPAFGLAMDYDHLLRADRAGHRLAVVNRIVSVMPATGVSSRETWSTKHRILREQMQVHFRNAQGTGDRLCYAVFWSLFYPAYLLKWHILRGRRFY